MVQTTMTGEEVKSKRVGLGMTQPELAIWLNEVLKRSYDGTVVSKWESETRDVPEVVALLLSTHTAPGAGVEGHSAPPLATLTKKGQPRIIAFANQKGGVGKTATACNVAAALAAIKKRVLLVDFDAQANATTHMGYDWRALEREEKTMYYTLRKKVPLKDIIIRHSENLWLAPSSLVLSYAEVELVAEIGNNQVLREKLGAIADDYDYILIDCPPNLGLLTVNALTAATDVMIPCQTEMGAVGGVEQLLTCVNLVKERSNPALKVMAILPTLFSKQNNDHKHALNTLTEALGSYIPILPPIPRATIYGTSYTKGHITLQAHPKAPGVDVFKLIARNLTEAANVRG